MELQSSRLNIRNICPDDWQSLKRIWNDFGKSKYAKYDVPHNKSDEEIKEQARRFHQNGLYFAVCLKGENRMLGYVAFYQNDDTLDLGYCFDSAYHGNGYAKESIETLLRHFRQTGIKKFTAGTGLKNIPSVKLLHSLGFQQAASEQVSFYKDERGNPIYFEGGLFELQIK